jgi:hypothetical protein
MPNKTAKLKIILNTDSDAAQHCVNKTFNSVLHRFVNILQFLREN